VLEQREFHAFSFEVQRAKYKHLKLKNMRKIKVYIAASLDGYIARPDGDLDWLTKYPITPEINYGYNEFFDSVDTVIMGGKTYRDILNMDVIYPYESKTTYVITRNIINSPKDNRYFITDNVIDEISELKTQQGKDIWLVGGGELITMMLNANLVDEMQICYVPVILGTGILLFPNNPKESTWKLVGSDIYDSGFIKVNYVID